MQEAGEGTDVILEPGMVFTIEPIIHQGGNKIVELDDWTAVTADGNLQ